MTATLDPRIHAYRPDLAASALRGQVEAPRFVDGTPQQVVVGQTAVRRDPGHHATMLTEALHGERVTVYEIDEEGWAWCQLERDGYVGWIAASALLAPGEPPTHRVMALRTFAFPERSIKAPPAEALPFGSHIAVRAQDTPFVLTVQGFIPAGHVAPLDAFESDPAAVAMRFLGAPYLWGGKTSLGLDCSGLVQVALQACGVECPRDSDMQERVFAATVPTDSLQRGDLVFWKGHVAMALDRDTLIHANAHHMAVAIEPATACIARIAASGSAVTSARRPPRAG